MGLHTWFYKDKSSDEESEYHDLFRTTKRPIMDSDTLTSRRHCNAWLAIHEHLLIDLHEGWRDKLNEFWDKYPNGYIEFN